MSSSNAVIRAWSQAYASQSYADWETYHALCLAQGRVAECERLHHLQMACEKLCKAHMMKDGRQNFNWRSHKCIAKTLPIIVRDIASRTTDRGTKSNVVSHLLQIARALSPHIESLAPTSDAQTPNAEYPWQDQSGAVVVPAEYDFSEFAALRTPRGAQLIKLLQHAAQTLK